ncbi:MAG TPA: NAD(P)H-dependent oxidoreductase [Firmicutes bacterium]|nr:NAD(P)H-dependent oxidoreductase [Bacillota bacterium]
MKTLIVYYSYGGNTRRIARMLQEQLGADMAEIATVQPYTGSYDAVVNQGKEEVESGAMPAIRPMDKDPADYDTILLGTPVWWYTFAPAVKTFLAGHDFTGKAVYPFITNGGWIGHTEKDIAAACPGANVMPGIDIRFEENRLAASVEAIRRWAQGIG